MAEAAGRSSKANKCSLRLCVCVCAWIERTRRKDGISKMGCDVGTRRGEQIASIINLCVCGEQWPA